jgi:hypothetical protein
MQIIKFNKTVSSTGSYVEIRVLIAERMAHRARKEDIEYPPAIGLFKLCCVFYIPPLLGEE